LSQTVVDVDIARRRRPTTGAIKAIIGVLVAIAARGADRLISASGELALTPLEPAYDLAARSTPE
jgi:hypothetical protein